MLAEKVVNLADKLHIKVEKINCERDNKKCNNNAENYKKCCHFIYPVLSDVRIQPHREHP